MSVLRATKSFFTVFLAAGLLTAASCGGSGLCGDNPGPASQDDPRCEALCQPPGALPKDGVGDYCSASSVTQCQKVCGVQIQSAATLCASCLLEKAYFGLGTAGSSNDTMCNPTDCTITNSSTGKSCTYPMKDTAARDACRKMLYPATPVECKAPQFRPVTECASVCPPNK